MLKRIENMNYFFIVFVGLVDHSQIEGQVGLFLDVSGLHAGLGFDEEVFYVSFAVFEIVREGDGRRVAVPGGQGRSYGRVGQVGRLHFYLLVEKVRFGRVFVHVQLLL